MDKEEQRSDEVELEVVGQVPSPAIALEGRKRRGERDSSLPGSKDVECLLLFGLLRRWAGQLLWEEELGSLHCSSQGSLDEASSRFRDSDTFLSCF